MQSVFRLSVVAMVAAALLGGGCAGGDKEPGALPFPTTTAGPSGTSSTVGPGTSAGPTSTGPTGTTGSSAPGATQPVGTTAPANRSPTVESEGWRLTVTRPGSGATIGTTILVCYELTGTSREPELVLEAALVPSGSANPRPPVTVGVPVGRGSARVDLGGPPAGRYDLRVQLIVNGVRLDGGALVIPAVTVSPGAPIGVCT